MAKSEAPSLDELFEVRSAFYLGNFQQCINEAQKLKFRNDEIKVQRDSFLYRAYIAQKKFGVPLDEISTSADSALKGVRLFADYMNSNDNRRLKLLEELEKMLKGTEASNSIFILMAASIYMHEMDFATAVRLLQNAKGDDLECMAATVQGLLKIDHVDLAQEVQRMQTVDEDAVITQIALASVNMAQGKEKLQEAFRIFQELINKHGTSPLLLYSKASCLILQEKYDQAKRLIHEAMEKDNNIPEHLINLVAFGHVFPVIRTGICPNMECLNRILFRATADTVKCRRCTNVHPVHQLVTVEAPVTPELALKLLCARISSLEKAGEMGGGRQRAASRAVDGISSQAHVELLQAWFKHYGVTDDGAVRRLGQMGRSDPFNVATLSDYAFAIRQEHMELCGYGRDEAAFSTHAVTIADANIFNGRPTDDSDVDLLVPLSQIERKFPWSTAAAVSKACVGREVFSGILVDNMREHLKRYAAAYKVRSSSFDLERTMIEGVHGQSNSGTTSVVLDLAVLANILRRCILLLDHPLAMETVQAFVPFLRKPKSCLNLEGSKRSPLILAWADQKQDYKLAIVASATRNGQEITSVFLPREWIGTVWGHSAGDGRTALDQYIEFDKHGRFIVCNGKYFKPEFLQTYVDAFEKEAALRNGVSPAVKADYVAAKGSKASDECSQMDITLAAAERRLWRCMRCWEVTISKNAQSVFCQICREKSIRTLRHQQADGIIEYQDGDILPDAAWLDCRLVHLRKLLGGYSFDGLFDDQSNKMTDAETSPSRPVTAQMLGDVKNMIANGSAHYDNFKQRQNEIIGPAANENIDALMREAWEDDAGLSEMESRIFSHLEAALRGLSAEQRLKILRSDPKTFQDGGFLFSYADRHFRREEVFTFPLLAPLKFAFSGAVLSIRMADGYCYPLRDDLEILGTFDVSTDDLKDSDEREEGRGSGGFIISPISATAINISGNSDFSKNLSMHSGDMFSPSSSKSSSSESTPSSDLPEPVQRKHDSSGKSVSPTRANNSSSAARDPAEKKASTLTGDVKTKVPNGPANTASKQKAEAKKTKPEEPEAAMVLSALEAVPLPWHPIKEVDLVKENLIQVLKLASVYLKDGNFSQAADRFNEALDIVGNNKSKPLLDERAACALSLCFVIACAEVKRFINAEKAEKHIAKLEQLDKTAPGLAHLLAYARARLHIRWNHYDDGLRECERAHELISGPDFKFTEVEYPGTSEVLPLSKPDEFKKQLEALTQICKSPPPPDARCRYDECTHQRRQIYASDRNFDGYYTVQCTSGCKIGLHQSCYKALTRRSGVEKDQAKPCVTPECDGFLCHGLFYDKDMEPKAFTIKGSEKPKKIAECAKPGRTTVKTEASATGQNRHRHPSAPGRNRNRIVSETKGPETAAAQQDVAGANAGPNETARTIDYVALLEREAHPLRREGESENWQKQDKKKKPKKAKQPPIIVSLDNVRRRDLRGLQAAQGQEIPPQSHQRAITGDTDGEDFQDAIGKVKSNLAASDYVGVDPEPERPNERRGNVSGASSGDVQVLL